MTETDCAPQPKNTLGGTIVENFFDPDSWIMSKLSDLGDLIIANILWIITSLPIITLGASTAALYSTVRTPGEHRYSASVFRNYFHAFVKNLKQGTLTLLLLVIPGAVIVVNLFLLLGGWLDDSVVRYVICAVPVIVFLFAGGYVFPLMACFENSLRKTLTNALVLSIAHLPTTLLVTAINLLPVAIFLFFTNFFYQFVMVWILFGFSAIAKINMLLLERVFARYQTE